MASEVSESGPNALRWPRHDSRRSRCPLCGARGPKPVVLEMGERRRRFLGLASEVARLLHCRLCDVRYVEPLRAADYGDAAEISDAAIDFYVEQGAGIDPMLEPLNLADGRAVARYVEVGCGFGFSLDYARSMLGWEVKGYDPGIVATAGRAILGVPIESVYIDPGNVARGSADLVYCSEVIEHVPDPDAFVGLLASMLPPGGQLLLTTPNAAAIAAATPREILLPILSPGYHLILYSARALTALLRRHGFAHIKIDDATHQLRAAASRVPFAGAAQPFTRERYRRYLAAGVERYGLDQPVGLGLGYRLLKEAVHAADYAPARAIAASLREAVQRRFGFDIATLDASVIPARGSVALDVLGRSWPYNLCGIMYFRGLIASVENRLDAAERSFRAAEAFGGLLRSALNAIGVEDGETAVLAREAEIARLGILARRDPPSAVAAFEALAARGGAAESVEIAHHRQRARRQLFTDLVMLGHHAEAGRVAGAAPGFAELTGNEGANAAFAWGIYQLNHKADYPAAAAAFDAVARAAAGPGRSGADLRWPARFHFALARRLGGDAAAAEAVADEMAAAGGESAPPPDLLARLGELRAR